MPIVSNLKRMFRIVNVELSRLNLILNGFYEVESASEPLASLKFYNQKWICYGMSLWHPERLANCKAKAIGLTALVHFLSFHVFCII
jgi:hypothetical protein